MDRDQKEKTAQLKSDLDLVSQAQESKSSSGGVRRRDRREQRKNTTTALIDDDKRRMHVSSHESAVGPSTPADVPSPLPAKIVEQVHPLLKRAEDFDQLSKMMAREGNLPLALDYSTKVQCAVYRHSRDFLTLFSPQAIKLRKAVFGEESDVDNPYMQTFVDNYAALGRQQYEEALRRHSAANMDASSSTLSCETATTSE